MTLPTDPITDPLLSLAADSPFAVDLSAWKIRDYTAWVDACDLGDLAAMNAIMAAAIRKWPYSGDPAHIDSYGALSVAEWKEAGRAISRAVSATFQQA